jgi:uncharacterized membrane protein
MITPANISKIPIHPILVTLPIGMWVFALVAQIVYVANGGQSWRLAASYTMIGGVVGAVLALIPGMIDYLSLFGPRVKVLATRHMLLNLSITVLFAIAFGLNIRGPVSGVAPLILAIIGVGLLSISGTLGFSMVFKHRVAVPEGAEVVPEIQHQPRERVRV